MAWKASSSNPPPTMMNETSERGELFVVEVMLLPLPDDGVTVSPLTKAGISEVAVVVELQWWITADGN
jgi:hypothetical protein